MDINWMIIYVNKSYPSCMLFNSLKMKLFENGNCQIRKSDNTLQKGLKERISNDILHVKCERKIIISQSNLLYPKYRVYVYKYLKRQKRPKTCQNADLEMAPNTRILLYTSFLIIPMHSVCRETFYFSVANNGKGGFLAMSPFSGPRASWLDQTGMGTSRPCILQKRL